MVIAGFEIPSDSPVFLGILAVHVPAGVLAVVTGVAAMLKDKRRGAHTRFGLIYFSAIFLSFNLRFFLSCSEMVMPFFFCSGWFECLNLHMDHR